MKNSKVIQILETLSRKELRRLEAFLNSPYFQVFAGSKNLFNVLIKYYPKFLDHKVERCGIYHELFQGNKGKKPTELNEKETSQLNDQFTQLRKLLFEFLVEENQQIERKKGRDRDFEITLLAEMTKRKLYKFSESLTKQYLKKSFPKKGLKKKSLSPNSLDLAYDYLLLQYSYRFESDSLRNRTKPKEKFIREVLQPLDEFFILQKLRYACLLFDKNHFLGETLDDKYWENQNQYIKTFDLMKFSPLTQAYYRVLALSSKDLSEYDKGAIYEMLSDLLKQHGKSFPQDYLFDLASHAMNYQSRAYGGGGGDKALGKLWNWYDYFDKHNLFTLYPEKLPPHYKNAITVAAKLGKYTWAWAEDFNDKYKDLLTEDIREDLYWLNMAVIEHAKGNFEKALKNLSKYQANPDSFYLNARKVLEFKITIDMNLHKVDFTFVDATYNLIKAAKERLRHFNDLSLHNKKRYTNFWKLASNLVRYLDNDPKLKASDFKKDLDIILRKPIYERDWLSKIFSKISKGFF